MTLAPTALESAVDGALAGVTLGDPATIADCEGLYKMLRDAVDPGAIGHSVDVHIARDGVHVDVRHKGEIVIRVLPVVPA